MLARMLSTTTATCTLSCAGRRLLALSLSTVPPRISVQHVQSIASCQVSSVRMFSTPISFTTSQPANQPVPPLPISLTPVGCDGLVGRWGEETHWSWVQLHLLAMFDECFFLCCGCRHSPGLSAPHPLYHSCLFVTRTPSLACLLINDYLFMDFAMSLRIVFNMGCFQTKKHKCLCWTLVSLSHFICTVGCGVYLFYATQTIGLLLLFFFKLRQTRLQWLPLLALVICQHRIAKSACSPHFNCGRREQLQIINMSSPLAGKAVIVNVPSGRTMRFLNQTSGFESREESYFHKVICYFC